jgi:hypothetical protein
MRHKSWQYLSGLAILLRALPIWGRTESSPLSISQPTSIGATQLQPGDYELRAQDSQPQVQVVHNGKVVAPVPCSWIQLPGQAADSEVIVDNHQVKQIQFAGKTEAISLNP